LPSRTGRRKPPATMSLTPWKGGMRRKVNKQ
jgi:hypothetical protein